MDKLDRKNLVKFARKKMGFTQVNLAEVMGVNQVAVSHWENGEFEFSDTRLFKLKREFDKKVKDYDKSQELFQPFIDEIIGVV